MEVVTFLNLWANVINLVHFIQQQNCDEDHIVYVNEMRSHSDSISNHFASSSEKNVHNSVDEVRILESMNNDESLDELDPTYILGDTFNSLCQHFSTKMYSLESAVQCDDPIKFENVESLAKYPTSVLLRFGNNTIFQDCMTGLQSRESLERNNLTRPLSRFPPVFSFVSRR